MLFRSGATAPRLHLELLAARLLVNSEADAASLAARLDGIERAVAQGIPVAAAPAPAAAPTRPTPPQRLSDVAPATAAAPPPVPAPAAPDAEPVTEQAVPTDSAEEEATATPVETPQSTGAELVDLAAIQALWPAAVELTKTLPTCGRLAWASAQSGWPVAATPTELTIAFANLGPFSMAQSRGFAAVYAQAANQIMGRAFQVILVHDASLVIPQDDAPAASMAPQPVAAAQPAVRDEATDIVIEPRRIIEEVAAETREDRKSTRLNSSH